MHFRLAASYTVSKFLRVLRQCISHLVRSAYMMERAKNGKIETF